MDELSSWLRRRMHLEPVPVGRQLELEAEHVFGLLEGVVELEGRLLEGPQVLNITGLDQRRPVGLPRPGRKGLVTARTPCVWGRAERDEVAWDGDWAALLQLRETREELRRRLRGLDDFLHPQDASIPAGAFSAEGVDMVVLVVRGPDVDAELEAVGLSPIPGFAERRLVVLAHYPAMGQGGRRTSYTELAEFLPCMELGKPALYARRILVDSFAAALVGRELYGFPKEVCPVGLGACSGWAQDVAAMTWSEEEHVDELDRLGAAMMAALLDRHGGLLERAVDLAAELLELDHLVHLMSLASVPLIMPDTQRATLRLKEPRQARKLTDLVLECPSLGPLVGGWRLVLDLELAPPPKLPVGPPRSASEPLEVARTKNYAHPVAEEALGFDLADELRMRARRCLELEAGERVRVPPGVVMVVELGKLLSHVLEEGGAVLEGAFRPGEVIGWMDDGLERVVEGMDEQTLALLVDAAAAIEIADTVGTSEQRHQAWLRDARVLGNLEVAREAGPESRWSLALPLPSAPGWRLPPGLEPREGAPTLLFRRAERSTPFLPFDLPVLGALEAPLHPAAELIGRAPWESTPRRYSLRLRPDLVVLALPCLQEGEAAWYVPVGWTDRGSTLLGGRQRGWPLRLGRFLHQSDELIMVSDGRLALRLSASDEVASRELDDLPTLGWEGQPSLGPLRLVLGFRRAQGAPLRLHLDEARARPPLFDEGRHILPTLRQAPLFGLAEAVEGRACSFDFGKGLA